LKPSILFLDEITSALDDAVAIDIMNEISALRGSITVVFVTHDKRWQGADRVFEMKDGRLNQLQA
jgi:ABC-type glutathione transport system ATPase component